MKILFLSHDATRTGAPIVLLHLIRWMSVQPEVEIEMLFLKGGDLLPEFKKLGEVVIVQEESLLRRVYRKLRNQKQSIHKRLTSSISGLIKLDHDIIYANTIICMAPALKIADKYTNRPKLVGHIHELKLVISQFAPGFKNYANKFDHYIVASNIVGQNLRTYEVPENKIDVVYEFSVTDHSRASNKEAKLDPGKFVIGGSGTVHWRKGHDAFIQVAQYLNKHYPEVDILFQWVGRVAEHDKRIIEEDLRKGGLVDVVEFTGETDDPGQYFQGFDIFLMTSREDPFPLVCIEVGQYGVPIICFDGATGTQEVIEEGGGKIVPYLDIKAMGDSIVQYHRNRNSLKKDSIDAHRIFSKFIPENISPQVFEVVKKIIK